MIFTRSFFTTNGLCEKENEWFMRKRNDCVLFLFHSFYLYLHLFYDYFCSIFILFIYVLFLFHSFYLYRIKNWDQPWGKKKIYKNKMYQLILYRIENFLVHDCDCAWLNSRRGILGNTVGRKHFMLGKEQGKEQDS